MRKKQSLEQKKNDFNCSLLEKFEKGPFFRFVNCANAFRIPSKINVVLEKNRQPNLRFSKQVLLKYAPKEIFCVMKQVLQDPHFVLQSQIRNCDEVRERKKKREIVTKYFTNSTRPRY